MIIIIFFLFGSFVVCKFGFLFDLCGSNVFVKIVLKFFIFMFNFFFVIIFVFRKGILIVIFLGIFMNFLDFDL